MTPENNEMPMPSEAKKWSVALFMATVLAAGGSAYVYVALGEFNTLMAWSFVSAAVASLMYATSLSASSVGFYTGWPNMKWGYQKQIGLVAFWLSLFYSITLLILYPDTYYYGFFENLFTADFIFGLSAMAIFAAMALINSKFVAPHFSWDTIKFVLGLGFIGYALLVIRAIFIEYALWEDWITTLNGFPPGRLVLSVIAIVVLLLRISIPITLALKKKDVTPAATPIAK